MQVTFRHERRIQGLNESKTSHLEEIGIFLRIKYTAVAQVKERAINCQQGIISQKRQANVIPLANDRGTSHQILFASSVEHFFS